jgi:hypothetical protein
MPRTKISEYSTTNSDNTDIESININEGCAPSGINNAIRELMVHLKEFQTGASSDPLTVAGTFVASGGATIAASAGTSASPSIHFSGDTNTGIFSPAADTIAFAEGGVESMRINSDGEVLINTSATRTEFNSRLLIEGTTSTPTGSIAVINNNASAASGYIALGKTRGAIGSNTTIVSGDSLGSLLFYGADGTGLIYSAGINVASEGTIATGQIPSRMSFSTASSAGTVTERMRITSSGEVLVGGTTAITTDRPAMTLAAASGPYINLYRDDTTVSAGNGLGTIGFYGNDTTSNTPTLLAYVQGVASGTHAAGDNPTDLVFGTTPDGSETVAEAGRITQSGAYVLKGGTTTAAAGVGIIFPATQVASANVNCLDDYEEGTWTPQYTFATSGSATMVSSSGTYTKVGNMVTVNFIAVTSAISSPTGAATITGLPFTSSATGEAGGAIGEVRRFATDMPNLKFDINPSSSAITLLKQATNAVNATAVDGADFLGTANYNRLHGTITYFV